LTIIPAGAADGSVRKTIELARDEIKLEDQRAKARLVELPRGPGAPLRLGVIDLPAFYGGNDGPNDLAPTSATADVAKLVRKLEEERVEGLILDLRRNGGGSLEEAITLTGLFIHKGPVVQTRGPKGRVQVSADTDASELYDGPLIVLTSRFSASASEILAGALQDYGRALIVGDKSTFGKGTVQTVVPLATLMDENHLEHSVDPGGLKVTIRKFYRPCGASTQLKGVEADIALPSLSEDSGAGEGELAEPLPWDRVPAAEFVREDHVSPVRDELRARSAARVAGDPDFVSLREEIAEIRKSGAAKTVSLNEADRRKEKAQTQAREEFRRRERAARQESPAITYDLTVKNAEKPGLPPPETAAEAPLAASPEIMGNDDDDAAPTASGNDPVLRESERILADYAELTCRAAPVTVAAH